MSSATLSAVHLLEVLLHYYRIYKLFEFRTVGVNEEASVDTSLYGQGFARGASAEHYSKCACPNHPNAAHPAAPTSTRREKSRKSPGLLDPIKIRVLAPTPGMKGFQL